MTKMFLTLTSGLDVVWCSVVRDLIVERWQTIFSDPSTLQFHNNFGTLCIINYGWNIPCGIRLTNHC
jgi:hypothetical protein